MRRAFALAMVIWIGGGAGAYAQANSTAGMAATSSLGIPGFTSSGDAGGNIPLGATEIAPPGLSPLTAPCPAAGAAFDGGGMSNSAGCSTASTTGSSGTSATSGLGSADAGPMLQSPSGAGPSLGATELGTPGESQVISVPNTSCSQRQGAGNSTNIIGAVAAGSC